LKKRNKKLLSDFVSNPGGARQERLWPAHLRALGASTLAAILGSLTQLPGALAAPSAHPQIGEFETTYGPGKFLPDQQDSNVDYGLDTNAETFFVHVPYTYTIASDYGLVVYIHPGDQISSEPDGWPDVLDHRRLLFIAPLNAGNEQAATRRLGLAVLAAEGMMQRYRINPKRVYASGWSGGGRIAGMLGFFQADVFHATIQSCGADFYTSVPHVSANAQWGTDAAPYGLFTATQSEIDQARHVRFTLITGINDFRHGNILDLYNGGFAKFGFQAKLFDIPGMGHDTANAATLGAALDYIESGQ
jgi:hypothetical protein